jgi:hypothetical protein
MVIGPVADATRKANGARARFCEPVGTAKLAVGGVKIANIAKIAKIANVFVITPPAILPRRVVSLHAHTPTPARRNDTSREEMTFG